MPLPGAELKGFARRLFFHISRKPAYGEQACYHIVLHIVLRSGIPAANRNRNVALRAVRHFSRADGILQIKIPIISVHHQAVYAHLARRQSEIGVVPLRRQLPGIVVEGRLRARLKILREILRIFRLFGFYICIVDNNAPLLRHLHAEPSFKARYVGEFVGYFRFFARLQLLTEHFSLR